MVQPRELRTESTSLPSAKTGTPAAPRLRATGNAVPPPPKITAGGLVADKRRLRLGRGRPTYRGATFVICVPSPPVPCFLVREDAARD